MIFGLRRIRNLLEVQMQTSLHSLNAEQIRRALDLLQSLMVAQLSPHGPTMLQELALTLQAFARATQRGPPSPERHQRLLENQARLEDVIHRLAQLHNWRNDLHL